MSESETLLVSIDRDKCVGHGRCYSLAPGVYDADDEGFAVLVDDSGEVTGELAEKARLGATACPEGAISLTVR